MQEGGAGERRVSIMFRRWSRGVILGLLGLLAALGWPAVVQASNIVHTGWDLFESLPDTSFGGVPFNGVPLGTFDFGGAIGTKSVGNTDTIVQRLGPATDASPSISTELVALHLMSAIPTDFGLGVGTYFITLQSERGGPASPGRMTINGLAAEGSPHGTFDSFFDVFFDIRLGALDGPIALSDDLRLTSSGTPWGHLPPPGSLEIPDVNMFLNGTDRDQDFWPVGVITEQHPTGALHIVRTTQAPEPSTLLLFGAGLTGLAAFVRLRAR
jgi:hypothetical protein